MLPVEGIAFYHLEEMRKHLLVSMFSIPVDNVICAKLLRYIMDKVKRILKFLKNGELKLCSNNPGSMMRENMPMKGPDIVINQPSCI